MGLGSSEQSLENAEIEEAFRELDSLGNRRDTYSGCGLMNTPFSQQRRRKFKEIIKREWREKRKKERHRKGGRKVGSWRDNM
jgi:hypothetical protein